MASRILVIDDNIDLAESLAILLEAEGTGDAEGAEVTCATTIAEGRRAFLDGGHDLVVLDIKLPDGNGMDFYYEIKSLRPQLPVLIITGYRLEQLMQDICGLSVSFVPPVTGRDNGGKAEEADITVFRTSADQQAWRARLEARGMSIEELSGFDDLFKPLARHADHILIRSDEPLIAQFSLAAQLRRRGIAKPIGLRPRMSMENMAEYNDVQWSGCMLKPFEPGEFLLRVREMIRGRQSRDSREVAA